MKRHFLFWLILTAIMISCKKEPEPDVCFIIMHTQALNLELDIAGTGTVSIAWGDGSENKTYTLHPYDEKDWFGTDYREKYRFRHYYPLETSFYGNFFTIKIKGENITHLDCKKMSLINLDASNNTALIYLNCYDNQLTNLNVSNNTALKSLNCQFNRLASLDVSTNIALTTIFCNDNKLSVESLDTLFGTLHSNPISGKFISISYNPGSDSCNPSIATEKGWKVWNGTIYD